MRRPSPYAGPAKLLGGVAVLGLALGWLFFQATSSYAGYDSVDEALLAPDDHPLGAAPRPPRSRPDKALHGLPPYPGARPQTLSDATLAVGLDLETAWFSTPDSPEKVLRFYEVEFDKQKVPYVSKRMTGKTGYVGYFNPQEKRMHVLSVAQHGSQTMVFPSSADVSKLAGYKATVPQGLPTPPSMETPVVLSMQDGQATQEVVSAVVPDQTLAQARAFYQQSFQGSGWELTQTEDEAGQFSLSARKGQELIQLRIRSQKGAELPGVSVYITRLRRA